MGIRSAHGADSLPLDNADLSRIRSLLQRKTSSEELATTFTGSGYLSRSPLPELITAVPLLKALQDLKPQPGTPEYRLLTTEVSTRLASLRHVDSQSVKAWLSHQKTQTLVSPGFDLLSIDSSSDGPIQAIISVLNFSKSGDRAPGVTRRIPYRNQDFIDRLVRKGEATLARDIAVIDFVDLNTLSDLSIAMETNPTPRQLVQLSELPPKAELAMTALSEFHALAGAFDRIIDAPQKSLHDDLWTAVENKALIATGAIPVFNGLLEASESPFPKSLRAGLIVDLLNYIKGLHFFSSAMSSRQQRAILTYRQRDFQRAAQIIRQEASNPAGECLQSKLWGLAREIPTGLE